LLKSHPQRSEYEDGVDQQAELGRETRRYFVESVVHDPLLVIAATQTTLPVSSPKKATISRDCEEIIARAAALQAGRVRTMYAKHAPALSGDLT
jgi:hypothetical protein